MKLRSIFRTIPILKRIYPSLFFKFTQLLNKNVFFIKFKDVYLNLDIRDPIDKSIIFIKKRLNGGETGIRTLGTFNSTHTFQACALNHSAISP